MWRWRQHVQYKYSTPTSRWRCHTLFHTSNLKQVRDRAPASCNPKLEISILVTLCVRRRRRVMAKAQAAARFMAEVAPSQVVSIMRPRREVPTSLDPIADEQAPVVAYWSSDDHAPPYPATGLTPPPRRILPLLDGFDRGGSHGQARRLQQLGQRPQWPQLCKRTGRRGHDRDRSAANKLVSWWRVVSRLERLKTA